jgi:hypothetical protein
MKMRNWPVFQFSTKIICAAAILLPCSINHLAAQTLDVNGTGEGGVTHFNSSFSDLTDEVTFPNQINLTGYNEIQFTWNAPAGYMYVVNNPGISEELFLQTVYAEDINNTSPDPVLSNFVGTFDTVYGTAPVASPSDLGAGSPLINLSTGIDIGPGFAFTSYTVTADVSGSGLYDFDQSYGTYNGLPGGEFISLLDGSQQELFLEPVPEPSTLVIMVCGAATLFAYRRRKN